MLSRKQLLQRKSLQKRSLQLPCTPQAGCRRQFAMLQNLQQLKWIKGKRVLMRRVSNLEGIRGEVNETKTEISKNALKTMTIKKLNQKPKQRKRFLKAILPQRRNQKSKLLLQLLRLKQRIQMLSKLRAQRRQPLSQN